MEISMTVKELIEKLQEFPDNNPIHYWNGDLIEKVDQAADDDGEYTILSP